MKKEVFVGLVIALLLFIILIPQCSRNVYNVKAHAFDVIREHGFEPIAFQGYKWELMYGGAVWYTIKRGNIIYQVAIVRWGDEFFFCNLEAVDAIKPKTE